MIDFPGSVAAARQEKKPRLRWRRDWATHSWLARPASEARGCIQEARFPDEARLDRNEALLEAFAEGSLDLA